MLKGHARAVTAVAVAPDGRGSPPPARTGRCGSGCGTGQERAVLTGHTAR